MWLINVDTLQLEEFVDSSQCKYAILSHTWGHGEVTFQDMQNLGIAERKPGFEKIAATCRLARGQYRHVWVDTCCIDKKSSAELSEAINSMFSWYRDAKKCYVFLSDVVWGDHNTNSPAEWESKFRDSRWFKRGWTLQELLAPDLVEFFSSDNWKLGDKRS